MKDQKEQTIKKRKKRKKVIITSLILIILIAIFSTIFAFININNEKIISGVTIKGIEVSGLTKEEAMAKLETIYSEKLEKDLKLKYGEYESELNPTLMEVKYDIEKAVNEAYLLGKDGNIFINNYKILSTLIQKKDINVNMTLNEEVTKQTINDMGQNLPGIMLESSYTVEGNKLIITKGKDAIFSTIFAFININNEKIISGVTIKGIEVSGLTKEEAMAKLETIYSEKLEKDLKLKYGEYESELNPTLMEVKYDIEKAVNEAYLLGKDGNIFINNYKILSTLIQKKDINVNMTLNEEVTKQTINDMGQNLPGIMLESSYTVEGNKLIITKGKDGIVIDTDTLLNKVKNTLNNINKTEEYIEIPTTNKSPAPIDIDKIHSEVYKEAKDAYYTKNPFTVYPEVEGVDFDVEAAKKMIETENKEEYVIQLKITKPKVTIDQIGPEAFPDQLSSKRCILYKKSIYSISRSRRCGF